jgi:predicted Zn-dependent protease
LRNLKIMCVSSENYYKMIHSFLRLEKEIALKYDAPGLNYGKALALARLGRTDKARETLKHLLALRPKHRKAQLLLDELKDSKLIS